MKVKAEAVQNVQQEKDMSRKEREVKERIKELEAVDPLYMWEVGQKVEDVVQKRKRKVREHKRLRFRIRMRTFLRLVTGVCAVVFPVSGLVGMIFASSIVAPTVLGRASCVVFGVGLWVYYACELKRGVTNGVERKG